ncbi:LytR C-terminal domain-containing protein [Amycolatopsis sp. TNS106]|uniref:LytR C-terminal domain-containing protein n=1 Tax=Amycolatopsis sp. TNS106 TaxID=2861750 RepID=UPI001C5A0152|nr:LytR C-terminal domain-containing protein [Amycolatopsis sp. TNS106]QXV61329.1 glycoprotein [Amycolatopsis sp. TNS106]
MSLFSGLSRPMKAAGLALVGVAVIAAVIGGITLTSGGGDSDTATPPGSTPATSDGATQPSSPAPGSPSASTPPASSAPPSSAPASSAPPASQPGQTGQPGQPGPGQPGGDQQASHKWVTVRVYNNSTIQGLAEQAAKDFRASGWNVSEVKGYPGRLPETVAYYRPGTDEEAAAKALALEFGFRAEPRFKEIENIGPGVIVILTKDYKTNDKDGS